jgi:hypothetical protein
MVKPVSPEPREEHCPACGAGFRLADRRKRVQCPHCMEIVEIVADKPAVRSGAGANAKELAELKTRLARLDALEARMKALELKLADLLADTRPVPAPAPKTVKPPPERTPKLIWHEPRLSEIAAAADEMPAAQHEALVANLAALGSRCVVIQAVPHDGAAALRAARLREIFQQATWTVPPVVEAPERLCRWELALVAQSGSAPRDMAELFVAIAASGFKPVSLIDPSLGGCDPIVCVGLQRRSDNVPGNE